MSFHPGIVASHLDASCMARAADNGFTSSGTATPADGARLDQAEPQDEEALDFP